MVERRNTNVESCERAACHLLESQPDAPAVKLALVTAFPRDAAAPRGGVEAVSVNLTRALARFSDLEVHVVTVDRNCRQPEDGAWEGAAIHRLPQLGRSTLWSAISADRRQVMERLRALQPDLVHAHDVYGLMVKGLPIPRVFTIHGFIHGDTAVSGERLARLRAVIWRRVETSGWADQPNIISISPYVRERLAGLTEAVVHDIDNPIGKRRSSAPR
jgi:glycosyltransferase involved in cell wall biosynthesis